MSHDEQESLKQISYAEAMRYMSNAKETLQKAGKEDKYYADPKYVRTACGTAYNGVLIAMDTLFILRGVEMPKKKRRAIEFYKANAAKMDGELLKELNSAYNILHLLGYYDGELRVKPIVEGFETAYDIISKVKPERELPPDALKKPSWLQKVAAVFA
jgi:hypothetical protein